MALIITKSNQITKIIFEYFSETILPLSRDRFLLVFHFFSVTLQLLWNTEKQWKGLFRL